MREEYKICEKCGAKYNPSESKTCPLCKKPLKFNHRLEKNK